MRQRDPFEGVAAFIAVADVGSFSEAARRLGVSPSAVSQAVRALEERLGTPLLRRSTRSVSLTDVGREYLLAVAPALSQLRQAGEEASGRGGRPAGPLRLTMPRAPFELLIAPMLVAFQEAYPNVDLEIAVERRMVRHRQRKATTPACDTAIVSRRTWSPFQSRPARRLSSSRRPLISMLAQHRPTQAI